MLYRSVACVAVSALLVLGACKNAPTGDGPGTGDCVSNDDCLAGQVCQTGSCLELCTGDLQCKKTGEACVSNVCAPCDGCRRVPVVTEIDGTGSADGGDHAAHHLRGGLVLLGANLEGVSVALSGGGYTEEPLVICSAASDTSLEVELPSGIAGGDYTLTVTNQAGTCDASVTLIQGEQGIQGPAGAYTEGPGISLTGDQVSVIFAGPGAANNAARSDHTHDSLTGLNLAQIAELRGLAGQSCTGGTVLAGYDTGYNAVCVRPTGGAAVSTNTYTIDSGTTAAQSQTGAQPWLYYPGLDVPLNLAGTAHIVVLAEGTQRTQTAGYCHAAYRLVVDGIELGDDSHGQAINVSSNADSWWDHWTLLWGSTLPPGPHRVRLRVHNSSGPDTCRWDGDGDQYDNERMTVLVLPGETPFLAAESSTGTLDVPTAAFGSLGASGTLEVVEDSDLVVLAGGTWLRNPGPATLNYRLAINGTGLGDPLEGQASSSANDAGWWKTTFLTHAASVTAGSLDIELQGRCDAGGCSTNQQPYSLQRVVAFALPPGSVVFNEGSTLVSSTNAGPFTATASINVDLSSDQTVLLIGSGTQRSSNATPCHGTYRLNIDGTPLGNPTHGQGIVAHDSGREFASYAVQSVQMMSAGSHTVDLESHHSSATAGTCSWNFGPRGTARLLGIIVP